MCFWFNCVCLHVTGLWFRMDSSGFVSMQFKIIIRFRSPVKRVKRSYNDLLFKGELLIIVYYYRKGKYKIKHYRLKK